MPRPFVRKLKGGHFWIIKIKLLDKSWKSFNTRIPVEFGVDGEPTKRSIKKAETARQRIQEAEFKGLRPFEERSEVPRQFFLKSLAEKFYLSRLDLWVPKTAENRRNSIDLILDFFGDIDVQEIGNEELRKFRASMANSRSNATVNSKLTDVYAILTYAKKECNAKVKFDRVFLPVEEKQDDYLSEDELERVLVASESVMLNGKSCRDFIEFCAFTGMRRGEAIACKRSWIKGELIVVPAWELEKGRRIRVTKNGKSRRVPIWERVANVLSRCPGDGKLFPEATEAMSRRFQKALCLAGIERQLKLHNLRDTFTVMALTRGVRIQAVREIVGDDLAVLMKHYAAVSSNDLVDAMKRAFGAKMVQD